MKHLYFIITITENKDQKSGTNFLLAEMSESKNLPLLIVAQNEGKKLDGDTFVFKLGSAMAKQVIACAESDQCIELDLSDFRTQQNALDGNKPLHIYLK